MKRSIVLLVILLGTVFQINPAIASMVYWYSSSGCTSGVGNGGGSGNLWAAYWETPDAGVCPGTLSISSTDDAVLGGSAGTVKYNTSSGSTTLNSLRVNTSGYTLQSYGGNSPANILSLTSGRLTIASGTLNLTYSTYSVDIGVPNGGALVLDGPGFLNPQTSAYVSVNAARQWIIGGGQVFMVTTHCFPSTTLFVSDAYRLDNGGTLNSDGASGTGAALGLTVGPGGGKVVSGLLTYPGPAEVDGPGALTVPNGGSLLLSSTVTNFGAASIVTDPSSGGAITLSGGVNVNDAPLTVGGAGTVTISSVVSDNAATYGGSGSGLLGEYYYLGTNFAGRFKAQVDSTVAFNWGTGTPEAAPSFGNALVCNGLASGYGGTIPGSGTLASVSGSYTVECWAKLPATIPLTSLCMLGTRGGSDQSFDLKFTPLCRVHADIGTGSAWTTTAADGFLQFQPNTWYHIAYVVTATDYKVYVNGSLVGRGTYASTTPLFCNATHPLVIGDNGTASHEYFNGNLDEIRVWSTARSQAQIQSTMLTTLLGTETGLVGYWKCDSGLTATTGPNGTLAGSTGSAASDANIPNNFSVSWTGQVTPDSSETYTFYTDADDGTRLWVNGTQIINNWVSGGSGTQSGTAALTAGRQYDIRLDYYRPLSASSANCTLSWSSPTAHPSKVTIPSTALTYSAGGLIKTGSGTVTLSGGANTYAGDTRIEAGTLVLDSTSTLGNGSGTLTLSGGTLSTSASRTASTAPVANPVNVTANSSVVTTSAAATVDLNFNNNSIAGASGTTLTFQNNAASGTGVFQPRFTGSGFTFAGNIAINNGSFGSTKLQSFNTSVSDQTFSGNILGSGSYLRTASTAGTGGRTIFSGNNTYSGGTTVGDGVLQVTGQSPPNSGTGSGSVAVNAGGTLSGNGRIGGAVTVGNASTAVLYPNNNATLTLGSTLTLSGASSKVKFNLSTTTGGANDKIVLENKNVTITTGTPQISINLASAALDSADYVLIDAGSGTISGSFSSTPAWSGTTPKYSSGYSIVTGTHQVTLHYTPIAIRVTAAANTKTYDGDTTATATPTVTAGSLDPADTGTWAEAYTSKNAGTGNKTLTPSGTVAAAGPVDVTARYNITFSNSTTGTITREALTVTAATNTKTYDGDTTATATPTITAGSIQTGDSAPTWTETYDTKNAGTGKTLTPAGGVISDGNGGANYHVIFTPVATGVITFAMIGGPFTSSPNPALPGSNVTLAATMTNAVPGGPGPAGNVLFKTNGVLLGDPVVLDGNGVATLITNSLAHGSNTVTAEFAGDSNFLGFTNSLVQVVNTPPVSPDITASVEQGQALVLNAEKLLAKASDPDAGDTLSLPAAGPTSTNGPANNVALDTGAGTITYTPATGFAGADSFTYTISDNYGGAVTPTVYVTVSPAGAPSLTIVIPPAYDSDSGTFRVTFAGIPNCTYTIQTATSPTGPWSFLSSTTAGTNGLFEVTDTELPMPPVRYYRTVYP